MKRVDQTGLVNATLKRAGLAPDPPRCAPRLRDLPASGQRVELWWHKRRLVCTEAWCERRSFTQTSDTIRPRARVTQRLRDQLADSIAKSNRAVSEVAAEYGVPADRWADRAQGLDRGCGAVAGPVGTDEPAGDR